MLVAFGATAMLALGVLFALMVAWTLRAAIGDRPRLSLVPALVGIAVVAAALAVMIVAPIVHGMAGSEWWPGIVTTYFLAGANRLVGGPYAFFWTPGWMYPVGSLTLLVPFGAIVALVGGWSALPTARRTAIVIMVVASCLIVAFVVAGALVARNVWGGIPV